MKFVGAIWKLLVGIKDAMVLVLLIIFFAVLYGALSARPAPVKDGVLALALNGSLVEQPARREWSDVAASGRLDQYRLRDLVAALDKAKDDSRVKAVALDLGGFTGGGATAIGDLADAVRRVRGGGQAGHRIRSRLFRRQLRVGLGSVGNLAQPAWRRADLRPGRVEPLLQGPARQARRDGQCLSCRHLQVGGRALHPQRHVAGSEAELYRARSGPARILETGGQAGAAQGEYRPVPDQHERRRCRCRRRHGQGRA